MKEDSLKKRYVIKLFANFISALVGAVIVAIVPKSLGPLAYGQFVYLQDFFIKLIGFLDMSTSIAFFTKLSAKNRRKELITFYTFYIFLVLILSSLIIYFINKYELEDDLLPDIPISYIYHGLIFGFLTWLTQIFISISDAYALTVSVEIIKIIYKILSLLLLFLFINFLSFDLIVYFYFHYITLGIFLMVLIFLFIKKNIFKGTFQFQFSIVLLIKEFIDYCHPLVIFTVASLIVGFVDIWLLQKVSGSEQTAFYGLSYSLAAMCFLFTSAITPIITREFSKSYDEGDLDNMRKLFFRYIPMLYSIAAYFAMFLLFQSENIILIFTDEKFNGAVLVLIIMAFYPIHQTYGQLSGSIFYATEQTKLYKNIGLISMFIGVILSFSLIYIYELGAVGLAIKMVITQFIAVNIQLFYNAKFLKFNMNYFLIHQLYSIVFFIFIAYIITYIVSFDSIIVEFLISGILYTLLVIVFSYIFPQVFATSREEIKVNVYRVFNYKR